MNLKTPPQSLSVEVWLFSGLLSGRNTPQITPSNVSKKGSANFDRFLGLSTLRLSTETVRAWVVLLASHVR